jgi:uncharacterized protein
MSFLESFFSLQRLQEFARELAIRSKIFPEGGRFFFLSGELGSGKTTFSRFFIDALSDAQSSASSPTFSYIHEHRVKDRSIFHCDFYRAPEKRIPEVLSILDNANPKDIFLLEWTPKSVINVFQYVPSTAIEFFHCLENPDIRRIRLHFLNPWSASPLEATKMWEEFFTPSHVRAHIEKVKSVALFCADAFQLQGVPVDRDMIESSSILHDALRYVDFQDIESFLSSEENPSPPAIILWRELHKKYKRVHHADAIGEILEARGYSATAKAVRAHNTAAIYRKEPFCWEEKIVYYADKRVLHDTIVSLKERLEDGRRRYHHEKTSGLDEKLSAMEKEIFAKGQIDPQKIFLL